MSELQVGNIFIADIKQLIQSAKGRVAIAVNAELTLLYWQVGRLISQEVLKGERGEYGAQVINTLSKELTFTFGRGWSKRNLLQMIKFNEVFSESKIVQALTAQLSWTHFVHLIPIEEKIKRDFYIAMATQERWSTRTLAERINSQLFERTSISKKPDLTIQNELELLRESGKMNEDFVLKDPYVLDFLELNDSYLEKDLEDSILRELQQFLLEMGFGFTFIARQHRIQIDDDDFYIDLLLYNRKLRRLVALDLKVGKFKAEYKGQMELYLRWLDKYETEEGENPPLGIILCTKKQPEQIELLELDKSGIHVAEYLTNMPPKELLEQKLTQAITNARRRFAMEAHNE
jgi:predicted nuclease of restriction endonuclease-like (RecB) superfamily